VSIRIPDCDCPWCSEEITAATDPKNSSNSPASGDATLCMYCGEWCVFDTDLMLRKPTDAEFEELAADETCRRLRTAWVELRKNRC
jgi:hypothetical protein